MGQVGRQFRKGLRKLQIFKEVPERFGEVLSWIEKSDILKIVLQKWEKSAVKHFIEKPMLLNFLHLSSENIV